MTEKKTLKDILTNHCQNSERNSGLLLLTLPTGFGKTHYVLEYIAEHLRKSFPQKIWFITNLKKNLPIDSLKERIGEDAFEKNVLFLNSYSSQIIESLKSEVIPDSIQEDLPLFFSLRKLVNDYENASSGSSYKNYLQDELNLTERRFRKSLKQYLQPYFINASTPEERLHIIRSTPKLRWIEKMYPSVLYFEKQVFFSTIDKFYLTVDTIIGPNIRISEPANIQDAIVFIDEFDATKENIKNAIINNAVKFNQDILSLFVKVFYGVEKRELPTKPLKGIKLDRQNYLRKKLQRIREEANRIYSDYQFEAHFYHSGILNKNRAFLFHDFEYHTVFESPTKTVKPRFLLREFDKKDQTNYIKISGERPKQNQESVLFLLNDLRSFVHLFSYFAADFARLYKESHDVINTEEISFDNAVRTILDLFDLQEPKTQQFFINHISKQQIGENNLSRFDLSPVNQGFRYFDVLNRKLHNETSKIHYVDTITTPESWLLNLCNHANVIGISATAGFDAPLSNYSLSRLQHHLRENFYSLSPKEEEMLRKEFFQKNKYADKRIIQPIAISSKVSKKEAIKSLFSTKETVKHFLHLFSDLEDFEIQRYIRVGKAYSHFILHPEIKSFLCLLNKFPKEGASEKFRISDLKTLFVELRIQLLGENETSAKATVNSELQVVNSKGFEEKLEQINEKLTSGERVFLMSTYQTMGAGQNIQYTTPKDIEVITMNDFDYGGDKKDYDGIYLEKPSYSLNFFREGTLMKDENLLGYLFEVMYLEEAGTISRKEKRERIEFAFRRKINTHLRAPTNQPLYERKAVAEHFCRVLIQAVGRLSRTRLKSPVTHILFDDSIKDYLKFFPKSNHLLVPEFQALLDFCRIEQTENSKDEIAIENINIHNTLAFSALLRKLVRMIPDWRQEQINFWEKLREFVLKNPTGSAKRLQGTGLQKFYISHPRGEKSDRYCYASEDDFKKNLAISFDKKIGKEMSFNAARINELLKVPDLQKLFIENGYATKFEPNDLIMSPPLFQNIYLGAIGEVVGEFILKKYSIPCSKLPVGEYELFDAKVSEKIYVDFKFWGAMTRVSAEEQKEKIKEKMLKASAEHVIIINIISPGVEFLPIIGEDRIVEIPGIIDIAKGEIIESSIQFIHQYLTQNV